MATKILIVDDEEDSLKLIGLMLQRQGFEVAMAANGTEALQGAVAEDPDLIILDVMMPDMDGYEVCKRLRANDQTKNIPIIMFTAKHLVDDKVAGFEAGADDYLTKPTHPAELTARIQALLARGASTKDQEKKQHRSFTYAFVGSKGGVGLSTLVTNVGALLAQQETATVVDFRLGAGTVALSLGYIRATGLADILKNPKEINSDKIHQHLIEHPSGLSLLPASTRSRESQLKLTPEIAQTVIKGLSELSQNVLVDLGPGLNPVSMTVLRDAHQAVLVVEPNPLSLALARDMLNEMRQAGIDNAKSKVVIVNRTQSSLQVTWQEAEQFLDHSIDAIIPPVPELAFQSVENEMPLAILHPDAVVATQLKKFAEQLARHTLGEAE